MTETSKYDSQEFLKSCTIYWNKMETKMYLLLPLQQ